jgi:hypothetical protein
MHEYLFIHLQALALNTHMQMLVMVINSILLQNM